MIKAGFYETDITPVIGMERPATYHKIYLEKFHDRLKVRACVLDDGGERVALVGVDTGVIGRNTVVAARNKIHEKCGIKPENILIAASHTHYGGPLFGDRAEDLQNAPAVIKKLSLEESICINPLYEQWTIGQIMTAVSLADAGKKEATLSIGRGFEDKAGVNRRLRLKSGRCVTHPGKGNPDIVEPGGPIDPEVGVIAAWDENDQLLGCIVNYACHATTYDKGVTADWIYYLEKTIKGLLGESAHVVFLNGAAGDITQVDNRSLREFEVGERWARYVGARVGAEAVKVLVSEEKGSDFPLHAATETLAIAKRKPSAESLKKCRMVVAEGLKTGKKNTEYHFAKERLILDYRIKENPLAEVEIQAIQIGPAVILASPAEYFCQFGLDIKRQSNFPFTFIAELANGCCGYVPTEDAFDKNHGGGYETVLTSYSCLEVAAGRKIMETCLRLAERLSPGKIPEGKKVEPSKKKWGFGALGPELE